MHIVDWEIFAVKTICQPLVVMIIKQAKYSYQQIFGHLVESRHIKHLEQQGIFMHNESGKDDHMNHLTQCATFLHFSDTGCGYKGRLW